jgi:hypothetical protein
MKSEMPNLQNMNLINALEILNAQLLDPNNANLISSEEYWSGIGSQLKNLKIETTKTDEAKVLIFSIIMHIPRNKEYFNQIAESFAKILKTLDWTPEEAKAFYGLLLVDPDERSYSENEEHQDFKKSLGNWLISVFKSILGSLFDSVHFATDLEKLKSAIVFIIVNSNNISNSENLIENIQNNKTIIDSFGKGKQEMIWNNRDKFEEEIAIRTLKLSKGLEKVERYQSCISFGMNLNAFRVENPYIQDELETMNQYDQDNLKTIKEIALKINETEVSKRTPFHKALSQALASSEILENMNLTDKKAIKVDTTNDPLSQAVASSKSSQEQNLTKSEATELYNKMLKNPDFKAFRKKELEQKFQELSKGRSTQSNHMK